MDPIWYDMPLNIAYPFSAAVMHLFAARVCLFLAVPQKRVSFVMTSTFVDDPDGEVAGKQQAHVAS